jgi:hypothetical protein
MATQVVIGRIAAVVDSWPRQLKIESGASLIDVVISDFTPLRRDGKPIGFAALVPGLALRMTGRPAPRRSDWVANVIEVIG